MAVATAVRRALPPPVANFLQPAPAGVFEQADEVAGVFEFVDVGPDLGLPTLLVRGGFATGGAAGVQRHRDHLDSNRSRARQFHENAADFLDLFVLAQDVLVAQQVAESEFLGLGLSLDAGVKWTVLRPQLLGGVACHPESLFVGHFVWFV
jgi:hypothetical protein